VDFLPRQRVCQQYSHGANHTVGPTVIYNEKL
jgi:hypothetical protein